MTERRAHFSAATALMEVLLIRHPEQSSDLLALFRMSLNVVMGIGERKKGQMLTFRPFRSEEETRAGDHLKSEP